MNDIDSPEARARREAYYNRTCTCGHAFGNHTIFSGCMLCPCGAPREKERTVEYTKLSDEVDDAPTS